MFSGDVIVDGAAASSCVRIQGLVSPMEPPTWSCAYAGLDALVLRPINVVFSCALLLMGGTTSGQAHARGPIYCFDAALFNRAVQCNRQIPGWFLGVKEAPAVGRLGVIHLEGCFG